MKTDVIGVCVAFVFNQKILVIDLFLLLYDAISFDQVNYIQESIHTN